jgi:hypothetical protein
MGDVSVPDVPRADTALPDQRWPDACQPDAQKPDVRPAPDGSSSPNVLLSYDFETNCSALVGTQDWQCGTLAFQAGPGCDDSIFPPPSCHSGTRCWGTVLNDCYNGLNNAADLIETGGFCTNLDPTDDSILTLSFQLPASLKNPVLEYWEWTDYFLPFDWTEVRINADVVHQDCTGSFAPPMAWVKRTIDLSKYAGKSLQVEFHFSATGVINFSGWYIDDVSVRGQ